MKKTTPTQKKLTKTELAALQKAVKAGRILGTQKGLTCHREITAAVAARLVKKGSLTPEIADWWHVYVPTDAGRQAVNAS